MHKRLTFLAAICAILASPVSLAQVRWYDDWESVRRLNLYRATLLTTISESERLVLDRVVLHAPLAGNMTGIRAGLADDGTPTVFINQGTHYAMQQIGKAAMLAAYVIKQDAFLQGYIRYVAFWHQFGARPKTAVQFAEYYGHTQIQSRIDALTVDQSNFATGIEIVLMWFITAHELAHHVYGDPARGRPEPSVERTQESRADAWAVQRIMRLGHSPAVAALSMEVMNAIERNSLLDDEKRRHPDGLLRAHSVMTAVLDALDSDSDSISRALARAPAGPNLSTYASALRTLATSIRARADEKQLLNTDANALLASANRGSIESQFRLSELYLTGSMEGIDRSKKDARRWAEAAATNKQPYEFFHVAYANYIAGKLVSNDKDNDDLACLYMRRSAAMGMERAAVQLMQFLKDGICKG